MLLNGTDMIIPNQQYKHSHSMHVIFSKWSAEVWCEFNPAWTETIYTLSTLRFLLSIQRVKLARLLCFSQANVDKNIVSNDSWLSMYWKWKHHHLGVYNLKSCSITRWFCPRNKGIIYKDLHTNLLHVRQIIPVFLWKDKN